MKKSKLPKTDSIEKLAEFWDTHDLQISRTSWKRSPSRFLFAAPQLRYVSNRAKPKRLSRWLEKRESLVKS